MIDNSYIFCKIWKIYKCFAESSQLQSGIYATGQNFFFYSYLLWKDLNVESKVLFLIENETIIDEFSNNRRLSFD